MVNVKCGSNDEDFESNGSHLSQILSKKPRKVTSAMYGSIVDKFCGIKGQVVDTGSYKTKSFTVEQRHVDLLQEVKRLSSGKLNKSVVVRLAFDYFSSLSEKQRVTLFRFSYLALDKGSGENICDAEDTVTHSFTVASKQIDYFQKIKSEMRINASELTRFVLDLLFVSHELEQQLDVESGKMLDSVSENSPEISQEMFIIREILVSKFRSQLQDEELTRLSTLVNLVYGRLIKQLEKADAKLNPHYILDSFSSQVEEFLGSLDLQLDE